MKLDTAFDRALKDDDTNLLSEIRTKRRTLLDFPETVIDGDKESLIAQWPTIMPPLPEYYSNPSVNEPVGSPLIINCSET